MQDYAADTPRSRKGVIAIAAVLGAVLRGLRRRLPRHAGSAAISGGEPPLIKANNEPTKVQPQNPGGVEIPNQNKQIYERADQSGADQGGEPEEQPVDVQQAVRMNGSGVADVHRLHGPGRHQQAAADREPEPRRAAQGPHRFRSARRHAWRGAEPPTAAGRPAPPAR